MGAPNITINSDKVILRVTVRWEKVLVPNRIIQLKMIKRSLCLKPVKNMVVTRTVIVCSKNVTLGKGTIWNNIVLAIRGQT